MQSSKLTHQILSLAGGTLLSLLISAVTTPMITRMVAPTVYGEYSLFNTWCALVVMLCSLGLDQTFLRYFYTSPEVTVQRRFLRFCLGIPLILTALCALLLLVYQWMETPGRNMWLVLNFILFLVLQTVNRVGMLVLRLKYRTHLYAGLTVLRKAVYAAGVLLGVFLFGADSLPVLLIPALAALGLCVMAELFAERKFWFRTRLADRSALNAAELLGYGLPLMAASVVFLVFQATDRFCVQYFENLGQVGVYSSAQSIMGLFSVITSTFQTLWIPRAIQHFEKDPSDRRLYREVNEMMTVIMFSFGFIVLICTDGLVLCLGENYRQAASVIPFLLLVPVMNTVSETTVIGLAVTKHSAGHLKVMCGAAIANFLVNILLTPVMGIQGAALSTGLSYVLYFFLRTWTAGGYFRVVYPLKRFSFLTIWFCLMCWYQIGHSFSVLSLILLGTSLVLVGSLYPGAVQKLWSLAAAGLEEIRCSRLRSDSHHRQRGDSGSM